MSVTGKHAASYGAYLNSPEWRQRRLIALEAAGFKCQRCLETENLEVHHLTYDRLGFERPQDLQVLCNPCHAEEHGRGAKNDRVVGIREAEEGFWAREHDLARLEFAQEDLLRSVAREAGVELPDGDLCGKAPPWYENRRATAA